MLDVFNLVLPFFGLIFLGFFVAKIKHQPLDALGWMNTFIVYVALPALFFQILSKTPVAELTQWGFIIGCTASTFLIFMAMFAVAFARTRRIDESTIQGLAAAYGNIGYMGPALAILAFGAPAAVPVALIFCFDNTLHFVMAPLMMALSGNDKRSPRDLAAGVLKKIFGHPFIIATIFGVGAAITGLEPPVAVDRMIDFLARAAAPCALFAMGATLALRPLRRVPKELYLIVPLKLVVQPVLIYCVLRLAGDFPPVWVYTAMLMAALPTATNVFVIAQQYGVWVERASSSVLATTLFSIVTLTLWLYAMTHGLVR
ncbi:AEC family transporter [Phyllobacterium sp. SYP-B3895]|uniref:AEC family transporter n=1 Tax=Phyllobacterium sp. SYP-B3895 TaxID=2663240 RepID=UPI001299A6AE|nr:AEC family transporter [Phyllobacterium sp. SYP-B3895]MRG55363.1 AEC family transporter [Phyllobacterium sp. SYP-B3895]